MYNADFVQVVEIPRHIPMINVHVQASLSTEKE